VKLVSEQGVGTIAAGVAKAHADVILISDTTRNRSGAADVAQARGTPWELGLAETHQTLASNGCASCRTSSGRPTEDRSRRDHRRPLGAEEFGFATAPLSCRLCDDARLHLDTCPVG